ncbi:MAG: NAD(P)-binding domain-containing protein [Bacteroidota bacterium]|nr:NAD(P)-binding domain-containing protein [Bacteroidota bacterium]MDP4233886.1 NAD(P)-binding domain-containing protein [Bacteroidota bacterium]MDP4243558.1 NAD(P)-binding domain-containing protein [Bacteroidota bacterium]MDP4288902.1 NAD(P)-binding domain-containing protein [Bacteroidota bacterium]
MKIGVLGTGIVGQTIGSKLIELGHEVLLGSRSASNEKAAKWSSMSGPMASHGTFAEAATHGELLFNCTNGIRALDALRMAGPKALAGKILIDVSNPLDFSSGFPPTLSVCNTESLGEQIQREFPETKVVKALNTVNCMLMVNPSLVPGEHDIFVSGNDAEAKSRVRDILTDWFGWRIVIDLGDITSARAVEQVLPIWVRLMALYKSPQFNFHIVRG